MANFDSMHVKSATKQRNSFDLGFRHLTSMNFGELMPLGCLDLIAGDKLSGDISEFCRTAPLALPTYGKININVAGFYVPYYQIYEKFDAFYAGKSVEKGHFIKLPTVTEQMLALVLIDSYFADEVTDPDAVSDITLQMMDEETRVSKRYRFNVLGKRVYKTLRALGYSISSTCLLSSIYHEYSALPLLAFVKVWNDYFAYNPNYDNRSISLHLEKLRTGVVSELSQEMLQDFFVYFNRVMFPKDYFLSAWDTPFSPTTVLSNPSVNPTKFGTGLNQFGVVDNQYGPFMSMADEADAPIFTQTDLNILRSFDSWARRNSYSGTRTLEAIYSRLGLKVADFDIIYAQMLSYKRIPLNIADVTSMADSGDATLGSYAGKAISSGSDKFNFRADDFGCFVPVSWIDYDSILVDGCTRNVLKTDPLDYYQPEFDGQGINAICLSEVVNLDNSQSLDVPVDVHDKVYGYTERYNEYRSCNDKVTGDLALSRFVDADNWTLKRGLSKQLEVSWEGITPSNEAVNTIDYEMNRIFTQTDTDEDKFYIDFALDIRADRSILNLTSATGLPEGGLAVHKQGNLI